MIPYLADVTMSRWPIANWCLIVLNVVVFALMAGGGFNPVDANVVLNREGFSFFQLLAHQFIHAGLGHLIGNMIFLWTFGNAINAKLGHLLFLAVYLAAGVFSALLWLLLGGGQYLVGASGAIMGVVALFAVYYPRNDIRVFYVIFIRPGFFRISAIWLILIYFALDLYGTVLSRGDQVAYIGHVAGGALGFVIGWILVATDWIPSIPAERNILQMLGIRKGEEKDLFSR